MKKRICLLTGASGCFGSAFIWHHAEHYQIVAVHHRREIRFASQDQSFVDPLSPSRPIRANEHAVHSIRADLSKTTDIEQLVRCVIVRFGAVDLLINAAAAYWSSPLLTPGALDATEVVFGVNVLAPLRLSVALAQSLWRLDPDANMRENRNIINVSSTAGLVVYEDLGQSVYAASRAALHHLTYHLASEFWDLGLRVNAVAPEISSDPVSIEDVLESVVALDASAQTGQVIPLYRSRSQTPLLNAARKDLGNS